MKITPTRLARIDSLSYARAQRAPQGVMCVTFWANYHRWLNRYASSEAS